jgi:hypothetical protein
VPATVDQAECRWLLKWLNMLDENGGWHELISGRIILTLNLLHVLNKQMKHHPSMRIYKMTLGTIQQLFVITNYSSGRRKTDRVAQLSLQDLRASHPSHRLVDRISMGLPVRRSRLYECFLVSSH